MNKKPRSRILCLLLALCLTVCLLPIGTVADDTEETPAVPETASALAAGPEDPAEDPAEAPEEPAEAPEDEAPLETVETGRSFDVADGYYLVGNMNGWTPSAAYRFTEYGGSGIYYVDTTLESSSEMKAVKVQGNTIKTYYPDGVDNNYMPGKSGSMRVYLRPNYDGDSRYWWNGLMKTALSTAAAMRAVA